ncbi:MAG: CRISPR-associated helicase Cas3', partial [Chloroflexales bacterium]|nr:CRISPR-associated helicase Cas3' [Chloroflexales bacterium]
FRPDQRFTLRLTTKLEPEQEARRLHDLVRDGGAVARICNRVDDAQAIYQALEKLLPSDQRILLHARFPLDQRQRLEQMIDRLIGKRSQRTPSQPLIVVGTQVLEQSLDYDVDVMVSDFTPIDLLLQRAGRLHRHIKERAGKRPQRHMHPVLEVALPLDADGLPDWKHWAPIYDPYILWRTWEVLRSGMNGAEREIVLPRDYRVLIEAVYQDAPQVAPNTEYSAKMAKALTKLELSWADMRTLARKQLTPPSNLADAIIDTGGIEFVEDEDGKLAGWQIAKTRLGDRVTVVPLYRVDGQLALDKGGTWPLSADIPPELDDQKAMIGRSVPVSDPKIIAEFRAGERRELAWRWSQTPSLLRSLFPLVLNTKGVAVFDGRTVRLDLELGLVIEKEEV